ncbi:hypothetical protein GCM10010441_64980 [Kitasatospora paracochleata]
MGAGTPLRPAGGTGSVDDGPGGDGTLVEVVRAAVAGSRTEEGGSGWGVVVDGFWCTVRPPGREPVTHGWRLHVSAAAPVAAEVLTAVSAAIAGDPCAFRFAADLNRLREISSRNDARGAADTFITVYPEDEEQFRRLAAELHRATLGLPGPVVRSGRPYRPGSRVHYRFGAFAGRAEDAQDGAPGRHRPPWAVDPVEGRGSTGPVAPSAGHTGTSGTSAVTSGVPMRPAVRPVVRPTERSVVGAPRRPSDVLPGGRYAVTAAVRHSAEGGVFLGRDTATGAEVVIKHARAHPDAGRSAADARTSLRREAELLRRLDGEGLTPRLLGLIEQYDSLFLVLERVPGRTLGNWVAARQRGTLRQLGAGRQRGNGGPDAAWEEAAPLASGLVGLVERVHARGLVLRDLSPDTVLVTPDGGLRLVDLELAVPAGTVAGSVGTPGYRAPEHTGPHRVGRALFSTDLYALGGLFFLLATGHDPLLADDLPHARPVAERLGRWLSLAARDGGTARRLAPAILGLRAERADHRWSLDRVRASFAWSVPGGPSGTDQANDAGSPVSAGAVDGPVPTGVAGGPARAGGSGGLLAVAHGVDGPAVAARKANGPAQAPNVGDIGALATAEASR